MNLHRRFLICLEDGSENWEILTPQSRQAGRAALVPDGFDQTGGAQEIAAP